RTATALPCRPPWHGILSQSHRRSAVDRTWLARDLERRQGRRCHSRLGETSGRWATGRRLGLRRRGGCLGRCSALREVQEELELTLILRRHEGREARVADVPVGEHDREATEHADG